MSSAHSRKKQPELIRRTLLDGAARLAVERGLGAITVQAVAEAAGVTKGGLFHHFPNKQALVEAVIADLLERLDAEIDTSIGRDTEPRGSFTRAYVAAAFADRERGNASPWTALSVSMLAEPGLRCLWAAWLDGRLARHAETDHGPTFDVVRLAADGVWLARLLRQGDGPVSDFAAVHERLIALTRQR